MMPGTDLAKVAKQFISEIFIAGDGVATNAKEFGVFDTYRIYDAYVTVGARGPDAVAAANAVAAFLASAH
jgi:phosphotransferase system HPr-like phosphotransfer protein